MEPFLHFNLEPELARIAADAFVAFDALVIGDVNVGAEASLWFGVVVRGDIARIRIGARTNIQDGSVLHGDAGFPCVIGDGVTVGHRCVVHGATVGDGALIGMSATILNGAVIGAECLVGAAALVTEQKQFPPRTLILGAPARAVRELTEEEILGLRHSAEHYVLAGKVYRARGFDQPRR